jgi:hypothetical protein
MLMFISNIFLTSNNRLNKFLFLLLSLFQYTTTLLNLKLKRESVRGVKEVNNNKNIQEMKCFKILSRQKLLENFVFFLLPSHVMIFSKKIQSTFLSYIIIIRDIIKNYHLFQMVNYASLCFCMAVCRTLNVSRILEERKKIRKNERKR